MGHPHPWNKLATGGSYCLQLKNPDGGSFHPEVKWPRNIKPQKKTFLKLKVRASKPADQQSKNEQECSPTQAKPCCTANNIFFKVNVLKTLFADIDFMMQEYQENSTEDK